MRCSNCRNEEFKLVKRQHIVKTRFAHEHAIVVENLPVHECKICGKVIIPEDSAKYIELLRGKIKREMEQTVSEDEAIFPVPITLSRLKNTIKRFIG